MIVLQANNELKNTFNRLIVTMKVPVIWNGNFVVIDDYMILQGEKQSLFFHFDTKKVTVNVIDIPLENVEIQPVGSNVNLMNVINMLLYIFGKWGSITGLKVEKDYIALNSLFINILSDMAVECEYTEDHLYFYKDGMRIAYEDVVQFAVDEIKRTLAGTSEREGGLWHQLIWTRKKTKFHHVETDARERMKARIGNNFYQVGYECPVCGDKMHMVVYPEGSEFRIETEEGAVLLARACTCEKCLRFYTPRPDMMFSEGDVYVMDFTGDVAAYQDYLELMGQKGEKVSNCNCNKFADGHHNPDVPESEVRQETLEEICEKLPDYTEEELKKITRRMEEGFYPDASILRLERKVQRFIEGGGKDPWDDESESDDEKKSPTYDDNDDGEFDDGYEREHAVGADEGYGYASENAIDGKPHASDAHRDGRAGRASYTTGNGQGGVGMPGSDSGYGGEHASGRTSDMYGNGQGAIQGHGAGTSGGADDEESGGIKQTTYEGADGSLHMHGMGRTDKAVYTTGNRQGVAHGHGASSQNGDTGHAAVASGGASSQNGADKDMHATGKKASGGAEHSRNIKTRVDMSDRFSDRQRAELIKEIKSDPDIPESEKKEYLDSLEQKRVATKLVETERKIDSCEGKPYATIKKVYDEVLSSKDIPEETKKPFLYRLKNFMKASGEKEVKELMAKRPTNMDRKKYNEFYNRLKSYEGVDLSKYEKELKSQKNSSEEKEIADLVKHARKTNRDDYKELLKKIDEGGFDAELSAPYKKKVKEKIRALDEDAIALLFKDLPDMSFSQSMDLYKKIEMGDFLPELKTDALDRLRKRLSKIKADECSLLQQKLKADVAEAGLSECGRHYYYPIRKVLAGQTEAGETDIVDRAMRAYASGREIFEYPIIVVDSSKNHTGREGMMVTPDHIFYSKKMTAYSVGIDEVEDIDTASGIFGDKLYVHFKDGSKAKLPYGVDSDELDEWAEVLDGFVHYLQQKPDSRDVEYLADAKPHNIICFRCGCRYQGVDKCPRCGYKNN